MFCGNKQKFGEVVPLLIDVYASFFYLLCTSREGKYEHFS